MRAILALIAACMLMASCIHPFRVGKTPAEDAATGARVGFTVGGPVGAAIGSVAMAVIGAVVRAQEKKSLRRRGVLTDKIQQDALTMKTEPIQTKQQTFLPTDDGA